MSETRRAHSLTATPGPVDGTDTECGHGGTLFANDPPDWAVEPCSKDAVWRVDLPNTLGTIAVCPFHLARWSDAYPNRASSYRHEFGCRFARAQPDPSWTTGRDLPRQTQADGKRWTRIGLDQHGHGRYYRNHPDGHRLLTFQPGWHVDDLRVIRGGLQAVLDHVSDTTGWVDIDPRVTQQLNDDAGEGSP